MQPCAAPHIDECQRPAGRQSVHMREGWQQKRTATDFVRLSDAGFEQGDQSVSVRQHETAERIVRLGRRPRGAAQASIEAGELVLRRFGEEKVYCGKEYVWDRRPSNVPSDREQFRVVRDVRRKRGIQRAGIRTGLAGKSHRSEERRVGREWSYRWWR